MDLQRFGNLSHFIIYGKYNVVTNSKSDAIQGSNFNKYQNKYQNELIINTFIKTMNITDSVPGPVRSFVSLKPLGEATKEMKGLSIFSEVALQTWPGFSISSPVPDILHLKNTTTVAVNVTDLSGSLADSYLKMYMPTTCENCKEFEGKLSIGK